MKKIISVLLITVFALSSVTAFAEEEYDPQHTMLALNMAIVSINRIVSTQDRIVLDQEYNNIINKLALGNIESDYELTALYSEMMNFITGRTLRQEEAKRFQERYNRREQRQIVDALSGIRAYGGSLWSWLGSLATSCVSQYFSYQTSKAELLEGLEDDLWHLKREDIEDCNDIQVRLLNSSWNLLRKYKLPDEYRLTQDSLNGFFKAVSEPDPSKRLRMLKARNVERNFQAYPPYWVYRAKAAQEVKDDAETLKCYEKFDEIWRPVLRNDPYKVEAAKYKIQHLTRTGAPSGKVTEEIKSQLKILSDNIQDGDWSNNLFTGVAYFLLGDKDEGMACVEPNVDFDYEKDISGRVLAQMKNGKLDPVTLSDELRALFENLNKHKEAIEAKATTTGWYSSGETVIFAKIGLVDRNMILDTHPKLSQVREKLAVIAGRKEDEARRLSDNEYDSARKAQVVQDKRKELAAEEQKLMAPIYRDCEEAVLNVAVRKNLTLVVDKFVTLIGGEDITQEVIQELKRMK